jgi:hypothetical protein
VRAPCPPLSRASLPLPALRALLLPPQGIMHPTEVMKNIVPVIMAGILGIYGLIVAAIIVG